MAFPMKKLITLLSVTLFALNITSNPINPQRALAIAQQYQVEGHHVSLYQTAPMKRAGSVSTPYYIFSRGANQGYVIVAGDAACSMAELGMLK